MLRRIDGARDRRDRKASVRSDIFDGRSHRVGPVHVNVFVARIIGNEYDGTVTYKRLTRCFGAARRAMVESGPPLPG